MQNRLYHVNDSVATGLASNEDISDPGYVFTNGVDYANFDNNYGYDEIGNLKKDSSEGIKHIAWTVTGKVKSIERVDDFSKIVKNDTIYPSDLEFLYDAMGNRIAKIEKTRDENGLKSSADWITTYYTRDAQGNIMSVYKLSSEAQQTSFAQTETNIYGSSRIGVDNTPHELISPSPQKNIYNGALGFKQYELTNHLGNVLTTVSDIKFQQDYNTDNETDCFTADIITAQDYYPFGMLMPGRSFGGTIDTIAGDTTTPKGSLVITEFSNGPSGTCEYVELFVTRCSMYPDADTVDIRGWLIDDNSGNFNYSPAGCTTGVGISSGHLRFSEGSNWAKIPVGTIIVLYNNADNCYNFTADTIGNSGVYYVPVGHTAMIEKSYRSSGTVTPNSNDCDHCGNTYVAAATSNTWDQINMSNTADAMQVRCPDCDGGFYHGMAYGSGFTTITKTTNSIGGGYYSGTGTTRKYELSLLTANTWQRSTADASGTPPATAGAVPQALHDSLLTPAKIPCCGEYTPIEGPVVVRTGRYRFGFNGQELDSEVTGVIGSHYTAEFWEYDSRLGRRWEIDPVLKSHESPYAVFANNPIWFMDHLGSDTSFSNSIDRNFVLDLINTESENYNEDFSKKFEDLVKSKTMYNFESKKYGDIIDKKTGNVTPGVTIKDKERENTINIYFGMGDDPMTQNNKLGRSKFGVLFEETFHAWDYETGGLNLDAPTCLNEAKAWKFASIAPGTKYSVSTTWKGKQYTDYTAMHRIKKASDIQISIWFKSGMPNHIDSTNDSEYFGINPKGEDYEHPTKGIYNLLPLK